MNNEHTVTWMKCPQCQAELNAKPNKEWTYRNKYYQVKSYKCPKCDQTTMFYYHNNEISHTITPKKGIRKKRKKTTNTE